MLGVSDQRRLCDDFAMTSTVCITSVWPEEHWNFKIWTTDIGRLNTVMCMWNHSILVCAHQWWVMHHSAYWQNLFIIFTTRHTVLNASQPRPHDWTRAIPCARAVWAYIGGLCCCSVHGWTCCLCTRTIVGIRRHLYRVDIEACGEVQQYRRRKRNRVSFVRGRGSSYEAALTKSIPLSWQLFA